jgi:hypothetical protein
MSRLLQSIIIKNVLLHIWSPSENLLRNLVSGLRFSQPLLECDAVQYGRVSCTLKTEAELSSETSEIIYRLYGVIFRKTVIFTIFSCTCVSSVTVNFLGLRAKGCIANADGRESHKSSVRERNLYLRISYWTPVRVHFHALSGRWSVIGNSGKIHIIRCIFKVARGSSIYLAKFGLKLKSSTIQQVLPGI